MAGVVKPTRWLWLHKVPVIFFISFYLFLFVQAHIFIFTFLWVIFLHEVFKPYFFKAYFLNTVVQLNKNDDTF